MLTNSYIPVGTANYQYQKHSKLVEETNPQIPIVFNYDSRHVDASVQVQSWLIRTLLTTVIS